MKSMTCVEAEETQIEEVPGPTVGPADIIARDLSERGRLYHDGRFGYVLLADTKTVGAVRCATTPSSGC